MDLNPDGPHTPEQTREAASLAAEAVRFLNHACGPHASEGLEYPNDADAVTGSLATLAARLPQLLAQLGDWLAAEHSAGRVEVAYGPFGGNPDAAVSAVRRLYAQASASAGTLHQALDAAAQITAALGGVDASDDGTGL